MLQALLIPRRLVMLAIAAVLVALIAIYGRWEWLAEAKYQALILRGIGVRAAAEAPGAAARLAEQLDRFERALDRAGA